MSNSRTLVYESNITVSVYKLLLQQLVYIINYKVLTFICSSRACSLSPLLL